MNIYGVALLVPLAVFVAAFTQTVSGFGVALVAMALLTGPLGLRVAGPLVSVVAGLLTILLLVRHWEALNWRAVWRMLVGAVAGLPFGLALPRYVPERWVVGVFGALLIVYAAYSLLRPTLPRLAHPAWAFASGAAGGMLAAAYNAAGPPAVVYASSQGWSPPEFKGNLQSFFFFNSLMVITGHAISGNFTATVVRNMLVALPAVVLGLGAGLVVERYIPAHTFHKIVLILLLITGLRLLFG